MLVLFVTIVTTQHNIRILNVPCRACQMRRPASRPKTKHLIIFHNTVVPIDTGVVFSHHHSPLSTTECPLELHPLTDWACTTATTTTTIAVIRINPWSLLVDYSLLFLWRWNKWNTMKRKMGKSCCNRTVYGCRRNRDTLQSLTRSLTLLSSVTLNPS